jgi:hypothetical protein
MAERNNRVMLFRLVITVILFAVLVTGCSNFNIPNDSAQFIKIMTETCDVDDPCDVCGKNEYCVSFVGIIKEGNNLANEMDICFDPNLGAIRSKIPLFTDYFAEYFDSTEEAKLAIANSIDEISCTCGEYQEDPENCFAPEPIVLALLMEASTLPEDAECTELGELGHRCLSPGSKPYCNENYQCSECASDDHCTLESESYCKNYNSVGFCSECRTDDDCGYGSDCNSVYNNGYECVQDPEVSEIDILAHEAPEFPAYLGIIALLAAITIALLISKRK